MSASRRCHRNGLPVNSHALGAETLKDEKRPSESDLITVVSHWHDFLHFAHSVLAAVNIDPDSLSFRNTAEKGWERGLRASSFVITDAATAARMPPGIRVRVFRVIADSSLGTAPLCRKIPHQAGRRFVPVGL